MTTINFEKVDTNTDFEALPEDRYALECIDAILAESKAGNDKITATFKVVDGSYANRRLWHDFSLVQTAWFNLKNYFVAAGIEAEGEIDIEDIPELMKGSQVSSYVVQTTFNKKVQNKLTEWASVGAGNDEGLFD